MSTISELSKSQAAFLEPYLPTNKDAPATQPSSRPFVTLTYACSLDGLISLSPGVRTTLSGPETKDMTHYLRLQHDAILVGAGTAVADNPSLNCRYPGVTLSDQPQPLILDPSLRWSTKDTAVVKLAQNGQAKAPWIIHGTGVASADDQAAMLAVDGDNERPLEWRAILAALEAKGLKSVMIEGGATVLNALLMQPDLVDSVIVTVAPTWLGQGGVHVSPAAQHTHGSRHNSARLFDTAWQQFGADAVLCGRLEHNVKSAA